MKEYEQCPKCGCNIFFVYREKEEPGTIEECSECNYTGSMEFEDER